MPILRNKKTTKNSELSKISYQDKSEWLAMFLKYKLEILTKKAWIFADEKHLRRELVGINAEITNHKNFINVLPPVKRAYYTQIFNQSSFEFSKNLLWLDTVIKKRELKLVDCEEKSKSEKFCELIQIFEDSLNDILLTVKQIIDCEIKNENKIDLDNSMLSMN